jgi:hypothetical protein
VAEANLISTLHEATHTETTLDRQMSEVWDIFRDIRRWYTEYSFEVVSGPPYETGVGLLEDQVLKVTGSKGLPRAYSEEMAGSQYYIQKNIKVTPQKEIVAVLSGSAYDWRRYTAFYVWRLTEHAAKTTISIDGYVEAELFKPLPTGEFARYRQALVENWHRSWAEAFASLKEVLGADAAVSE